jgi:hypothetical protein
MYISDLHMPPMFFWASRSTALAFSLNDIQRSTVKNGVNNTGVCYLSEIPDLVLVGQNLVVVMYVIYTCKKEAT